MIIEYGKSFLKEVKQLSKKFKLLKSDLKQAVDEIENKNDLGVYLGFNLFKKRVKNSPIPTEDSGEFRVIIYQQIKNNFNSSQNYADDKIRIIKKGSKY